MAAPGATSDESGKILDEGAAARVVYVFEDGHRRTATLTVGEAARLRAQGFDSTSRSQRIFAHINWGSLTKWASGALAGALIANYVGDQYADRQAELELEAGLVTDTSAAAIALYQDAQVASRSSDPTKRRQKRDIAADQWVLASGDLTPRFRVYYPDDSLVVSNWNAYQSAMYDWAILGCCTSTPGRRGLVDNVRAYVEEYVGPPNRPAPVADPWGALAATDSPDSGLYQWVGLYLLRGRGSLMEDLREQDAMLD